MKHEFVKTMNNKLFRSHILIAQQRGARESGLVSLTGRPGEGKSHTLRNWAAEVGAVMLTAQVDWSPRRMMLELAEKLGVEPIRGYERRMEEMITLKEIPIIVDEAGFCLINNAVCLERLRGITDKTSTLLVLVFMPHDLARLESTRLKQLHDRINTRCEFKKSTLEDVALACNQLSEVPLDLELVTYIHAQTDACMRLVMNTIARIESAARMRSEEMRNTPMKLADIKDIGLFKTFGQGARRGGVAV